MRGLLRRLLVFYLIEALALGASSIAGYLAYSMGLVPVDLLNRFRNIANEASSSPIFIFENNALIATLMSIPAIGVLFFGYAMLSTGVTLGSYVAYQLGTGYSQLVLLLSLVAVTVILPHGILELGAYALALVNSLDGARGFIACVRGRAPWGSFIARFLAYYAATLALLLVAAYVEYMELQYLRGLLGNYG